MKQFPNNIEFEKAIIAAILLNNDSALDAFEIIKPDDFYFLKHKEMITAIIEMMEKREGIDAYTLNDTLLRKKLNYEIDIMKISTEYFSSGNIKTHCQKVKDLSVKRRLMLNAMNLLEKINELEAPELIKFAEDEIFSISSEVQKGELKHIEKHLIDTAIEIDGDDSQGIPIGFSKIDMTGGLKPDDLIILAARTSMGKTALALRIALNVASRGLTVAFFSLEMGATQLCKRMISMDSGMNGMKLHNGKIAKIEYVKVTGSMGKLKELPIYIDDSPTLTPMDVLSKCKKLKAKTGLDLIISDYVGFFDPVVKNNNREQQIAGISRFSKRTAKELHVPYIMLSQLSRELEKRTDKRPILSDLRESGALEQDADRVLFIYRDEVYDPQIHNEGKAELIQAKHRNGACMVQDMNFNKSTANFTEQDNTYKQEDWNV